MEVHSWRRKTIESGIETAVFGGGASSVVGPFCFASFIQSVPRFLLVAFCQHIRVSGESRLVAVVAADSKTHPVELAVCSASMGVLGRPLSAHADGLNRQAEMRCRCRMPSLSSRIQAPRPPHRHFSHWHSFVVHATENTLTRWRLFERRCQFLMEPSRVRPQKRAAQQTGTTTQTSLLPFFS